ncbi:MAG: Oligoendopeptidase F, plasmid [Chloroflexi bacterium ADurb.Bin360]|nr:MAG: Oligoendopeptidase F, plasmid [Chloroflexi bacterium ADurb.Bin360]
MTFEPKRWILDDLMARPGSPEAEAFLRQVDAQTQDLEGWRERLDGTLTEADFAEVLRRYEQLHADVSTLYAYAYLWFSEDTAQQEALVFRGKVQQMVADVTNRTLFFSLWWKALDADIAERLLAVSGDCRYHLEALRLFTPHTLSEPEERVINIKDVNGIETLTTLYDMITTRFAYQLTAEGESKDLTRGQLMAYAYSSDADLRKAAYQELYRHYEANADVLAQVYAARVRDWYEENVRLRHFSSPISVRNLANDIPDPVTETLLRVIRKNAPLFQRYFRFKAAALGLPQLRRYDIYAPLNDADKTYTFDDAVRMVDAAYRDFSPRLADLAMQALHEQHLDSEVRPRKMDGAYCYGVLPGLTPWVLVNYAGTINDVSTLAHELGHSVHALMAAEHSPLTFHSALPMAETASVFGEILLTDKMLREETDVSVRRTLLNTFLSGAYATVMRQAYFVLFENQAHAMLKADATPDALQAAYLDNLREQFGDAVEVSEEFKLEWLSIPHIYHTPFYCYAYSFGQLLVLALYRKYKAVGRDAFEPQYLRILAYGGSASPHHILGEAGFDMTSEDFWQGGFDVLAEMLDELERLA